jgi:hypothetical protein
MALLGQRTSFASQCPQSLMNSNTEVENYSDTKEKDSVSAISDYICVDEKDDYSKPSDL